MSAVLDRLTALLAGATAADLDDLNAEIARLTAVRDLLTAAQKSPVAPGKPKPAAPGVDAPRAGGGQKRRGRASMVEERRARVAALLLAGPMSSPDLARRIGAPTSAVATVLGHPWFQKGPHRLDPWELSEAGRSAATAAGPA